MTGQKYRRRETPPTQNVRWQSLPADVLCLNEETRSEKSILSALPTSSAQSAGTRFSPTRRDDPNPRVTCPGESQSNHSLQDRAVCRIAEDLDRRAEPDRLHAHCSTGRRYHRRDGYSNSRRMFSYGHEMPDAGCPT